MLGAGELGYSSGSLTGPVTRFWHSLGPKAEVSTRRSRAWPVCWAGWGPGAVLSRPGKDLVSGSRDQGPLLWTPSFWH